MAKFYKKDGQIANFKVADDWQEFEDEYVSTPIGERLKSEIETEEFKNLLKEYELGQLRAKRDIECFSIINRGALWYRELTYAQEEELNAWYKAWLDVTETKIIPEKPTWLK